MTNRPVTPSIALLSLCLAIVSTWIQAIFWDQLFGKDFAMLPAGICAIIIGMNARKIVMWYFYDFLVEEKSDGNSTN